jgi:hypothetical protein
MPIIATTMLSNTRIDVFHDDGSPARKVQADTRLRYQTTWDFYSLKPSECDLATATINDFYELTTPGRYLIVAYEHVPKELGGGVVRSSAVVIAIVK